MLRLAESLVYEMDEQTGDRAHLLATTYMANLAQLSGEKLAAKKDEVKRLRDVCKYLIKAGVIENEDVIKLKLEQIIKDQGWDKKKS